MAAETITKTYLPGTGPRDADDDSQDNANRVDGNETLGVAYRVLKA
jgi:hypothetical protein